MTEFARYKPRVRRKGPPAGLMIRAARAADLPAMAEIAARREGGERSAAGDWMRSFERVHAEAKLGRGLLLCAGLGVRVLGYAKATHFTPDPQSPSNAAPEGWYLSGVVVRPEFRRRGVAARLTRDRLAWIAGRAREAYYFANARNRVSIDLHERFGFVEVTRDFWFPDARFEGGAGVLFICDLGRGDLGRGDLGRGDLGRREPGDPA